MGAKKILLVDDDTPLRESLAEALLAKGEFVVDQADCATAGLELALANHYDVMVLDVSMPDMNGCELCHTLRKKGITAPILMLTGADSDHDTVQGLESGANDYVTKPFSLDVLLARIRVHVRQYEQTDNAVLVIGHYDFTPSQKQLVCQATRKKIRLTDKETSILKYLYKLNGGSATRESLLDEVWGYNPAVTTHTLETHIYRLRQKIEAEPSHATLLLTSEGGYCLAMTNPT